MLTANGSWADVMRMSPAAWYHDGLLPHKMFRYSASLYAAPVALSTLAQLFPPLSSWTRSWRWEPLKSEPGLGLRLGLRLR